MNMNVLDGARGVMPPSFGDVMAIVGPAADGPLNMPAAFGQAKHVIANYRSGSSVEAACYAIEYTGKPVVFVRTGETTQGSLSAVDALSFRGTSVPTLDAASFADDEYEVLLVFPRGGTVGTAGITYRWSLDGGRTLSPETALGQVSSITLPEGGNLKLDLAQGSVLAGDWLSFRSRPAQWSNEELSSALTALRHTNLSWRVAQVLGSLDPTALAVIGAELGVMAQAGKYRWAIGNVRGPNLGEEPAAYVTALAAAFSGVSDKRLALCAGYAKILSSVSRRVYRRPISLAVAARAIGVDAAIDLAELDLGALPGVQIRDANQNPDEHDEAVFPGLDDARFTTLRSVEGYEGVYITNPRLFSPTGSDFTFIQHRRVMDIACEVVRTKLMRRLSKPLHVHESTGFILEEEARDIESGVNSALRTALLAKKRASFVKFVLSRTDNILSTFTLNGQAFIVPLGYPKFINTDIGFHNPALRTVKV
ncbi:DUF2586 family protein [Chondromyces crocatus]|uniref:DUF2586 family protein n=1 Tax=Chondromyces crocatus TaxID=52 RepID=UPI0012E30769|nr:DUF2586 family protein [Chondromyces crocatus]